MNTIKLIAQKIRLQKWPSKSRGFSLLIIVVMITGLFGFIPVNAAPATLYVDGASGTDSSNCQISTFPCQTIGYAITQTSVSDTIQISQGTYTENLTIDISIQLEGGYETVSWSRDISLYETIIDGSGATDEATVTILAGFHDVVLDGLTITGGDHDDNGGGVDIQTNESVKIVDSIIKNNQSNGDGGGIYALGSLNLIIENVEISDNQSGETVGFAGNGGGLYVRSSGMNATLENVQIFNNTAIEGGGGVAMDDDEVSVTIKDSEIYNNTATSSGGGGIKVMQGSGLSLLRSSVKMNTAPNNEGGGLTVGDGGVANIADSIIANNSTNDHGGAVNASQATVNMTNVLITGNQSTSGNANVFAIADSDVNVINSTISDNNPSGAQAVILWSGSLTMKNSIMWNNSLNLQSDPDCPTCFTVTYSDIEGGWTGTGNINEDPMFVDPSANDYSLTSSSPCIDSGTPVGAPAADIEGNPRDSNPDMGAYEWMPLRIYVPLILRQVGS